MLASAETKAYWLNKEQFILKDGVLFTDMSLMMHLNLKPTS